MSSVPNPSKWLHDLAHGDEDVRHRATLAIGSLLSHGPIDCNAFLAGLSSAEEKIVYWSIIALGRVKSQAEPALPALASLARTHVAFGVRQAAISALRQISPNDSSTRSATFQALHDKNPFVRREALQSIAALRALTATELDSVRGLAADPDEIVRNWCAIALRQQGLAP